MKLSASAINTYIKCGYKYKLDYIDRIKDTSKRSFSLLYGDIVGTAVANCAKKAGGVSGDYVDLIRNELAFAWETYFHKYNIPAALLVPIVKFIKHDDFTALDEVDLYADCINVSPYEFKLPKKLKDGSWSKSAANPRLSVMVQESFDMVLWFLESPEFQSVVSRLKDIELESAFADLSTGHTLAGRFDLHGTVGQTPFILEFKCTKTEYTQELVNRLNQVVAYQMASPDAKIWLVDLRHRRVLEAAVSEETLKRYAGTIKSAALGIEHEVFLPICSTDPFTEKTILCEHKCGACPFAGGSTYDSEI